MEIVLGADSLASPAGSESYLVSIAEQLERLGHSVVVHARVLGEMAEVAGERGLRVVDSLGSLPTVCEAVLAHHSAVAYELADRYPGVPSVYVAHSTEFASQLPPQAPGAANAVVVMNERVRATCEQLAHAPQIARLCQPIDLQRFGRFGADRTDLTRVVAFGNDQGGGRLAAIKRCCERIGAEFELVGRHGRLTRAPEEELGAADAVVAIGRCAIEGMAARRAVYVSGVVGTDGWLTRETYPAIEADGFSGRALAEDFDEDRFQADLERWTPALGQASRDRAYRHHDAADHAGELVRLWSRLAGDDRPAPPSESAELARLARSQAALESRVGQFAIEARAARSEYERLLKKLDGVGHELGLLKATRRYRIAAAMARPLDAARRLKASFNGGNGPESHD